MRGHLPRIVVLAVLLVPVAVVAQIAPGHSGGRGGTAPAAITATSRPVRLLRTWVEPVKGDSGRRVDVMVDYASGTAWEKFTSLSGAPLGTMPIAIGAPRPSPEEIDEAFDFTRQLPELAPTFRRFPNLVLEGGFILREPQGSPCGPGTRCLHVFLLSPDRAGLIRRIVVDLAHLRLAYKSYVPPSGRFE
ncbi:MAG TPA: hypothetical protein VH854_08740 [Thermoanaerobaculia bacterium]|jgi:hypothetical protein|nr:hypothetical protein [Thermoanaerobaculia bacterium]